MENKDLILFQLQEISKNITEIKTDVKEVKEQTNKTNNRVNMLEYRHNNCEVKDIKHIQDLIIKETELVRLICKYPIIAKLVFFGILALLGINTFDILKTLF